VIDDHFDDISDDASDESKERADSRSRNQQSLEHNVESRYPPGRIGCLFAVTKSQFCGSHGMVPQRPTW
jgi:hypothetical protein